MPERPCPNCPAKALRFLPGASDSTSYVNYYRCDACGHVFTVSKADPDGPPRAISHKA